jgi:hypothetical protein
VVDFLGNAVFVFDLVDHAFVFAFLADDVFERVDFPGGFVLHGIDNAGGSESESAKDLILGE